MSPSSLRVLSGAAAAVFALLTAIAVGLVSRPAVCTPTAPVNQTPSVSASPSAPAANLQESGGARPTAGQERPPPTNNNNLGPISTAPPGGRARGIPDVAARADLTPVLAAPAPTCDDARFYPKPAVVALLGAGITGGAVLMLLLLAMRLRTAPAQGSAQAQRPAQVPATPARPAGPDRTRPIAPPVGEVTGARTDGKLLADRAALVRVCIYVRDRVSSRALADRLATALNDVGVVTVEPVGERFDPARHEAGGATPATDPLLVGTIAAVEVPGYTDRGGRVLRPPIVTVYQAVTGRSTQPRRAEEDR